VSRTSDAAKARAEKRLRAALDLVAEHLRGGHAGGLTHGSVFEGKIRVDEFQVELAMTVRRAVASADLNQLRRDALARITESRWFDGCAVGVRDRGSWTRGRTKQCEKPVVAVIVSERYGDTEFDCRCQVHLNDHRRIDEKSIKAVIKLSKGELEAARAQRKRDAELRERFANMTEVERIAHDAELEGRVGDAAEIRKDNTGGS
jgi:hypothetical protein